MIRFLGLAFALLLPASCGIETVEYLPAPPVNSYTSQTDFSKLTYTHPSSTYSSISDFQGYEIYYKIYTPLTGPFDNLANDVNLLASAPTRDYLVNLGYTRLSAHGDNNAGGSLTVPLIPESGTSSDTITLDFNRNSDGTGFLSIMNSDATKTTAYTGSNVAPKPTVTSTNGTIPVYRQVTTSGTISYPWFSDLYILPFTTQSSDMQSTITQSTQYYQICFFLVAYAFSPEATTYSQPMPWGVIGGSFADTNDLRMF